jgi:NACalpha-BTF3-like transcription factor
MLPRNDAPCVQRPHREEQQPEREQHAHDHTDISTEDVALVDVALGE